MIIASNIHALEQGFRIGPWRIRPAGGLVQRYWPLPDTRRIEPKVMQVLLVLAARPREFVSKDELFASVWGHRPRTDDCLTRAIHALRQALGDDPRQPRYVETRNTVGYRLIAPVRARGGPARLAAAAAVVALAAVLAAGMLRQAAPTDREALAAAARELPPGFRADWLEARLRLVEGGRASLEAALSGFSRLAVARPEFAPAWLGQAEAGLELFKLGHGGVEGLAEAKRAAERALATGGASAELSRCRGQILLFLDWDVEAAESEYRQAIRAQPEDPVARTRLAWLLVARGDYAAAAEEIEQIRLLDPGYYASQDMAALRLYAGQGEAAIAEFERLDRSTRLHPAVLRIMASAYWAADDLPAARAALIRMWQALRPLSRDEVEALAGLDFTAVARRVLAEGLLGSPVSVAAMHGLLGEYEAAQRALDRAEAERAPQLLYVGAMPEFAAMRGLARFRDLLARLKLATGPHDGSVDPRFSSASLSQDQPRRSDEAAAPRSE